MSSGISVHCADDCPEERLLVSCKQLNVLKIDRKLAILLNARWHSRMPKIGWDSIGKPEFFGCEFNRKVYAIAMWSLPIAANRLKNGFQCLELRRMAVSSLAPKFTPSRMLSVMTKWIKVNRPDVIKLISYQDTGVHKGTIYKASGWTPRQPGKFISWQSHSVVGDKNAPDQSTSQKIRWELVLRENLENIS